MSVCTKSTGIRFLTPRHRKKSIKIDERKKNRVEVRKVAKKQREKKNNINVSMRKQQRLQEHIVNCGVYGNKWHIEGLFLCAYLCMCELMYHCVGV